MLQDEIIIQIEAEIASQGYELVRVSNNMSVINITIDHIDANQSINLSDCGRVHRHIINVFGEDFCSKYSIEVSSPGIDRGLFKITDYAKFVGRKIRINLSKPISHFYKIEEQQESDQNSDGLDLKKTKKINCVIQSVDINRNLIKLLYEDVVFEVDFNFISSAKLALPDDLFNK